MAKAEGGEMKVIVYDMIGAYKSGFKEHPQAVMRQLGFTYALYTPQSINESWWFWMPVCKVDSLPEFMIIKDVNPDDYLGLGLDEHDIKKLKGAICE